MLLYEHTSDAFSDSEPKFVNNLFCETREGGRLYFPPPLPLLSDNLIIRTLSNFQNVIIIFKIIMLILWKRH